MPRPKKVQVLDPAPTPSPGAKAPGAGQPAVVPGGPGGEAPRVSVRSGAAVVLPLLFAILATQLLAQPAADGDCGAPSPQQTAPNSVLYLPHGGWSLVASERRLGPQPTTTAIWLVVCGSASAAVPLPLSSHTLSAPCPAPRPQHLHTSQLSIPALVRVRRVLLPICYCRACSLPPIANCLASRCRFHGCSWSASLYGRRLCCTAQGGGRRCVRYRIGYSSHECGGG